MQDKSAKTTDQGQHLSHLPTDKQKTFAGHLTYATITVARSMLINNLHFKIYSFILHILIYISENVC